MTKIFKDRTAFIQKGQARWYNRIRNGDGWVFNISRSLQQPSKESSTQETAKQSREDICQAQKVGQGVQIEEIEDTGQRKVASKDGWDP